MYPHRRLRGRIGYSNTESRMAMSKSLVIVESPAKAKTIEKYLGKGFEVRASIGHIMDLPKNDIGVELKKRTFVPELIVSPGKEKVVDQLKRAGLKADEIFLAPDPDREGEAIAAHLALQLGTNAKERKKIRRVTFNEITKKAVQDAFQHARDVDQKLVDAQQTRRVLDRLVGYQISPLLWDKVRRGLSAGRVQTVAVRLIVEREREINAFKPVEYWTLEAFLHPERQADQSFNAKFVGVDGQPVRVANGTDKDGKEQFIADALPDEKSMREVLADLEGAGWSLVSLQSRERQRRPQAPFITSQLQREAATKLKFNVRRTMGVAQRLYEGIEIGPDGLTGLITYMRTDSPRVAPEAIEGAREWIGKNLGKQYLPATPNAYKGKKDARDAHEAIRPTDAARTPESIAKYLTDEQLKLYRLIWQRFVASQMVPAMLNVTTANIAAVSARSHKTYDFRASGTVVVFDGFLKVYEEIEEKKDDDDESASRLPNLEGVKGLALERLAEQQKFTQPPPRYNEATLVKVLEEKGIGRPSTYATILSVIQNREYVEKQQGRFYPTELGMVVSDLLVKNFSDIFDVAYTARMEEELDEVEEGKLRWTEALKEFYTKFKKDLRIAEREMEDLKGEGKPTDEKCEKCGRPMNIRLGRNGAFLACTGYPECDGTSDLTAEQAVKYGMGAPAGPPAPQVPEQNCEKCGKPMAVKRGRFGYFLACTGYPECRNTKKIVMAEGAAKAVEDVPLDEKCPECGNNLMVKHGRYGQFTACSNYPQCKYVKRQTLGIPCPEKGCSGEIVARRTRRGKSFYGCSRYPECKFTAWDKPVAEPCPNCASPIMLEKMSKKSGPSRYCANEACKYEHAIA